MKEKFKLQKGITLIALVITIIILLVLAIVSIKLLVDHGIIGHAKNATRGYTVEQEKELIAEGYANYKMAKYAATDTTEVEKLQKYFDLGLENVLDQEKMQNSGNLEFLKNDIIPDADTSLSAIGYVEDNNEIYYRLSYKNNTYRMFLEEDNSTEIGMKVKKIEFESTPTNSNEETEDLKRLTNYFKSGAIYRSYSEIILIDNDIIKGSTEIRVLYNMMTTEYFEIQYKNYIYKVLVEPPQSCMGYYEFKGIEIEGATFIQDVLNVQGATTKGNEQDGWIVTFDKSGNVYTLLSNGKITPGEAQNPETPSIKVNLKELLDKKYAEYGADKELPVAHMEEGPCSNKVEAHIWTYKYNDHYFIMYKSASNNNYIMFLENITVQDFAEMLGGSTFTTINANITELNANMWYKAIESTNPNGSTIFVEITMPNSIISDFADEDINDKEVYNAIIMNNTETPTKINLKELANSKLQANNTESMNVALNNKNASITISKINTNIVVIFTSQDGEKYFMSIEDTNTKDIATLIDNALQEKNITSDMWYQIKKDWSGTRAEQVKMPTAITGDFEVEEILDLDLYTAIIGNTEF